MNPLAGGLQAPASAPSYYGSPTSTAGMAVLVLMVLAVFYGVMAGYLARADSPRFKRQFEILQDYLAGPMVALSLVFVLVLVRYTWRVIG